MSCHHQHYSHSSHSSVSAPLTTSVLIIGNNELFRKLRLVLYGFRGVWRNSHLQIKSFSRCWGNHPFATFRTVRVPCKIVFRKKPSWDEIKTSRNSGSYCQSQTEKYKLL